MPLDEEQIRTLLRAVDDPTPSIPVTAIVQRAESAAARERARRATWMKRAAAIVLAVGIAGAAYALPGSPVRAWIRAIVERIGGAPPRSFEGSGPAGDPSSSLSGIALPPGPRLTIEFARAARDGRLFVSLTDGAEVEVRAPAGKAAFTTSADRLVVDNREGSSAFAVRIPRSAPWVEIRAAGERILLKEGDRVETAGAGSRTGDYVLPLAHAGP